MPSMGKNWVVLYWKLEQAGCPAVLHVAEFAPFS
jgi:hypothetical protein